MNQRLPFAAILAACVALLGFGYYLQYAKGLEPCPMCMMQRFAFLLVALVCLVGFVHGPRNVGRRIYGALLAVPAATGGVIAGRQIWLQHLPEDKVPECGPGWNYMVEVFPLQDVIRSALLGTGDCAEVTWTFLGRSIPEWSILFFAAFALTGLVLLLRGGRGAGHVGSA